MGTVIGNFCKLCHLPNTGFYSNSLLKRKVVSKCPIAYWLAARTGVSVARVRSSQLLFSILKKSFQPLCYLVMAGFYFLLPLYYLVIVLAATALVIQPHFKNFSYFRIELKVNFLCASRMLFSPTKGSLTLCYDLFPQTCIVYSADIKYEN